MFRVDTLISILCCQLILVNLISTFFFCLHVFLQKYYLKKTLKIFTEFLFGVEELVKNTSCLELSRRNTERREENVETLRENFFERFGFSFVPD
jgi:hypothetical protein